jgi:hypothetical protein
MDGLFGRGLATAITLLVCCCALSDSFDTTPIKAHYDPESPQIAGRAPSKAVQKFQAETLSVLLQEMADDYGASPRCPLPRSGFEDSPCILWAIQQMLTTSSASDGAVGGAFRIPYFWHWTEPNPRLSIVKLPEERPLGELPPPEEYSLYKSYGTIDRIPMLYFSDLVGDVSRYRHPTVGEFMTFGWCSEREMALCALLRTWGYGAKVHQSGIHVTTRVWLGGEPRPTEALLDTTFDSARLLEATPPDFEAWSNDFGEGADVSYYNRVCQDEELHGQLREMRVPESARERLTSQAEHYFSGP